MNSYHDLLRCFGRVGLVVTLFLALCVLYNIHVCLSKGESQPKRLQTAAIGDCTACHGNSDVLPRNHIGTKGMDSIKCEECHEAGLKVLREKIPLTHMHLLNGVTCADCHENPNSAKPLTTAQCLSCHGTFEEVADATKDLDPNPHNSPHYGTGMDCDLCHHQHSKSENFCAQCHEWELLVP